MNVNSGYGQSLATVPTLGAGKVFHVCQSGTPIYDYLSRALKPDDDGVLRLYGHSATSGAVTTNALKAALAQTVADRNDYVIVWPATTTYYVDEALSINKKGVHLICPAGLNCFKGATNAARIQQITANTGLISIAAQAVEVAGLYLKHSACATGTFGVKGSAIDVTTGSSCPNIHHNYFAINGSGATNSPIIALLGGASGVGAWGQIHHNRFTFLTDSTTWANIIQINTGANNTDVSDNDFNAGCGAGVTLTYIVECGAGALYCTIDRNTFSAGATNGPYGITESTITACIYLSLSSVARANRGSVAAGTLLAGGVAARSFCDNIDGASSTGAGMASQLET